MEARILVICRDKDIRQTIVRLLDGHQGWKVQGVATDEEAMELFSLSKFHVVLLGSGVDDHQAAVLSREFLWINPSAKIVKHYGGGSGLLFGEIYDALRK